MSRSTRSESQRREAVARWRRSGVTAAEFAARLGVSKQTLYGWSARVRREGAKLVELVAPPPDTRPRVAAGSGGDDVVEIALRNGRVLRAPLGVDDDRLGRLITMAESA